MGRSFLTHKWGSDLSYGLTGRITGDTIYNAHHIQEKHGKPGTPRPNGVTVGSLSSYFQTFPSPESPLTQTVQLNLSFNEIIQMSLLNPLFDGKVQKKSQLTQLLLPFVYK